jgi:hypothetical protein
MVGKLACKLFVVCFSVGWFVGCRGEGSGEGGGGAAGGRVQREPAPQVHAPRGADILCTRYGPCRTNLLMLLSWSMALAVICFQTPIRIAVSP